MNDTKPIRILLLEDTSFDARLVKEALAPMGGRYKLSHVERLREAIALLDRESFDIVITDLSLPDSESLETFSRLREKAPRLPIIILSGLNDEKNAENMVREGAQDYFVKGHLTGDGIARAMRHAIERKRLQLALEEANLDLEERVMERTAELAKINASLSREIVEHRRTGQSLQQVNHRLRALSARMLHIQEDERRQVARDLHDEIGQTLTAVKLNLQTLRMRTTVPEQAPSIDESINAVDDALAQVRSMSLDLRPPQLDDLGLEAAVRWHLARQAKTAQLDIELTAAGVPDSLPSGCKTASFRIVQEAVNNIVRHAGARKVWVELQGRGEELEVAIRDDGRGFDTTAARFRAAEGNSLGLISMEERATLAGGYLELESAPGAGTKIRARFSLTPEPSHTVRESDK